MRLSPAGLLVASALVVPLLVQVRTVLAFFDVHVSIVQTLVLGVLAIGALVCYAVLPGVEAEPAGESNGG